MHPKTIAKQIIDFNKANFDNTFDAITALQDHSEKMVRLFLEKASFFPPEGKKVITEWMESYKKGKKDFKESVDDSFKTVEHFFVDSAGSMDFSVYELMEKTNQFEKEVTDKIENAFTEVIDKSVQTKAVVTGKTVKHKTIAKKETVVEGKPGAGPAKAVRKAVKAIKKN
jgi:hypothetical protein